MTEPSRATPRTPAVVLGIWCVATFVWWGLAFLPAPGVSPEWLEAARAVCFGTQENGLPDTWGWMVLIFGPLSFLVGIIATWGGSLRTSIGGAWSGAGGRALVIAALVTLVWMVALVAVRMRDARRIDALVYGPADLPASLPDEYPRTDRPAPPFSLVDQTGAAISLASFEGRPLVMTFAFAHCRTICPAIVEQCRTALEEIGGDAAMAIITLDPWRDTPSALARFAEKSALPARAHILSGPVDAVNKTLDDYAVLRQRDEKTGDVVHPAMTYVIDGRGRIVFTFSNAPASWLAEAVRRARIGSTP